MVVCEARTKLEVRNQTPEFRIAGMGRGWGAREVKILTSFSGGVSVYMYESKKMSLKHRHPSNHDDPREQRLELASPLV